MNLRYLLQRVTDFMCVNSDEIHVTPFDNTADKVNAIMPSRRTIARIRTVRASSLIKNMRDFLIIQNENSALAGKS